MDLKLPRKKWLAGRGNKPKLYICVFYFVGTSLENKDARRSGRDWFYFYMQVARERETPQSRIHLVAEKVFMWVGVFWGFAVIRRTNKSTRVVFFPVGLDPNLTKKCQYPLSFIFDPLSSTFTYEVGLDSAGVIGGLGRNEPGGRLRNKENWLEPNVVPRISKLSHFLYFYFLVHAHIGKPGYEKDLLSCVASLFCQCRESPSSLELMGSTWIRGAGLFGNQEK